MKASALVMGIVTIAIGVGTYFALGLVPPGIIPGVNVVSDEESTSAPALAPAPAPAAAPAKSAPAKAPASGPSESDYEDMGSDDMGSDDMGSDDMGADDMGADDMGADDMGAESEAEDVAEEMPAAASANKAATAVASPGSDYASSEAIERALANEPPPEDDYVDAAAYAPAAPAKKQESKPVAKPEPKAETKPEAKLAEAKPAAAPKPEPKATAKPEAKPAEKAEAKPAAKPEPKAAPKPAAKPTPKPAPAPVKQAEAPAPPAEKKAAAPPPAPKASSSSAAGADALKPWWPDPSQMPENQLKLIYAGQVKGQMAIALLFSDKLELDSLRKNSKILGADGSAVGSGEWQLGNNPKLAIYTGIPAGRYTVVLLPQVTGGGFMLGTKLQGPVYVNAP